MSDKKEETRKIEAHHIVMKDLFSSKYVFEIPNYQRPFAWEKENFECLFEDIKDSLDLENRNGVGSCKPYFLGSIILLKKQGKLDGSGTYEVIDGQQRLVSLSILIAVLRDISIKISSNQDNDTELFEEYVNDLKGMIYQKASKAKGTPETVRIKVRERDMDFFRKYVLMENGTTKIKDCYPHIESGKHMIEAIKTFKNSVDSVESRDTFLDKFIPYLLQNVTLVVIKTEDLESAFRLFNVINSRGMPLTNADLLKSENLAVIPENKLEKYTNMWEDLEEDFGIETLDMLISFIRGIKLKEKARKNIYEEYRNKVFKEEGFKGEKFIDYLSHVAEIYRNIIKNSEIKTGNEGEETYYHNLISLMTSYIPFNDWMMALIKFKEKFNDDRSLYNFIILFEKKIVIDWVTGLSFTKRLTQIFKIINLIEESPTADYVINNRIFHEDLKKKKENLKDSLGDSSFYGKDHMRIPKYILLRIEMERKENSDKKIEYNKKITLEHILPKKPYDSYWLDRFKKEDRLEWTDSLGNLVLLNRGKNSQASNKPFPEKIIDYFEINKRSDFEITNELRKYPDWDLLALKKRHEELINEALKIWVPI